MSSSQVQMFDFNGMNSVRTVTEGDVVWFVAKDVADALGYSDPMKAINLHCERGCITTIPLQTAGGIQDVKVITESAVYDLIFDSRLESAKSFRRWVTTAVLPTIRKTGSYNHAEYLRLLDDNGRLRDELNEADDFSRAVCTDYEQLLKLVRPYKMPNWLRN